MRALKLVPIAALLIFVEAHALNNPGSQCIRLVNIIPQTVVWTIDEDLNAVINASLSNMSGSATNEDVYMMVDQIVQNIARQSRAELRERISWADDPPECGGNLFDGVSCIFAERNTDPGTDCVDWWGIPKYAGSTSCNTEECDIRLCPDNFGSTSSWQTGTFDKILAHELGHAHGLQHVNDDAGTCNSTAGVCNGGTNGCDGEIMCSGSSCKGSSQYTRGDGLGLRRWYNDPDSYEDGGFYERAVFQGADAIGSLSSPTIRAFPVPREAVYAPRIDCSRGSSPTYKCASATAEVSSTGTEFIRISRHNTWSSTNGWTSAGEVASLSPANFSAPPDITVSPNGLVAYLARTSNNNYGVVTILKVDLSTGAITSYPAGHSSVVPARIAYYSDILGPIVMGVEPVADGSSFDPPRWWAVYLPVGGSGGTEFTTLDTVLANDLSSNMIVSDFDFDCNEQSGNDDCVIVAIRRDNLLDSGAGAQIDAGRPWSLQFIVSGGGLDTQASWVRGEHSVNSVQGVVVNDDETFVSFGRPILDGTSTDNTRVSRFTGTSIASSTDTILTRSDGDSCGTGTYKTFSTGAATMHGGYSIAWCPTCTSGQLQSLHFGHHGSSAFCF